MASIQLGPVRVGAGAAGGVYAGGTARVDRGQAVGGRGKLPAGDPDAEDGHDAAGGHERAGVELPGGGVSA